MYCKCLWFHCVPTDIPSHCITHGDYSIWSVCIFMGGGGLFVCFSTGRTLYLWQSDVICSHHPGWPLVRDFWSGVNQICLILYIAWTVNVLLMHYLFSVLLRKRNSIKSVWKSKIIISKESFSNIRDVDLAIRINKGHMRHLLTTNTT